MRDHGVSRLLVRAREHLARPTAWIDADGEAYVLRLGGDRRARAVLRLDEADFRQLIVAPGLAVRPGGGWRARSAVSAPSSPQAGRPGVIEGRRTVMEPDGRIESRLANIGESPIAWLARRKDQSGRPWLDPVEVAAGERLRAEAEAALCGPSVTMRWDALPRSGAGTSARVEPTDRALSAARRVEAALAAVGPRLRPMLDHICVRGTALQLAETELGLRRRQGKTVLKHALQALAEHYGLRT
jgi:hypothetical protein